MSPKHSTLSIMRYDAELRKTDREAYGLKGFPVFFGLKGFPEVR